MESRFGSNSMTEFEAKIAKKLPGLLCTLAGKYDVSFQAIIEESWTKGEQTVDIGKHFPGCAYIINFCNMTQVRSTTGQVRKVRRLPQAAYPMVRLTQAEIASMLHRKQERIRERAAEVSSAFYWRIRKKNIQENLGN